MSVGGDGLKAEQLKQSAHKDIYARSKGIRPQELVPVRTIAAGHAVKHTHHRLNSHLKLPRHQLKSWDHKDAQQQRRQKQCAYHHQRGDVRRIYILQPEQADTVRSVKHRVAHGRLHGFRLSVSRNQ